MLRAEGQLIGVCGLVPYERPGTPTVGETEIGWQLAEDRWRQGFAHEAASAALGWGWANLPVPRIVAITVPANRASVRVMERLGMQRRADLDFAHPSFPAGNPLSAHIVYAAERPC